MEGNGNGLIYGLEFQCRALASFEADGDNVRFVVGTQGPRASNQVQLQTYMTVVSFFLFWKTIFKTHFVTFRNLTHWI
jgi:hypothetical protein